MNAVYIVIEDSYEQTVLGVFQDFERAVRRAYDQMRAEGLDIAEADARCKSHARDTGTVRLYSFEGQDYYIRIERHVVEGEAA